MAGGFVGAQYSSGRYAPAPTINLQKDQCCPGIMTVTLDVGVQTLMELEHQAFLTPSPFICSCCVCALSHSDNEKRIKLINL